MKWLKSTTSKSYTAEGKTIPAMNQTPLAVSDELFDRIAKMAVIKSLIKTGGIIVLDKYTEAGVSSDAKLEKIRTLSTENENLRAKVAQLEAAAKEPSTETSEAEIKLAELEAKYAQLEAEANQKISELATELEEARAPKKSGKKAQAD